MTNLDIIGTTNLEVTYHDTTEPLLFNVIRFNLPIPMLGRGGLDKLITNWSNVFHG